MFSRLNLNVRRGRLAILQPIYPTRAAIPNAIKIAGMAEAIGRRGAGTALPAGPIARCLPAYRFCFAQRGVFREQSMGIHYNKGAELLDFVKNKEDFSMDGGFKPLTKPGLGVRH